MSAAGDPGGGRRVRELVLASRSPRRLALLREHGYSPKVVVADLDDGDLRRGRVSAGQWVTALAYLKARAVYDAMPAPERSGVLVLAGDTVVDRGGEVIGQPADVGEARAIIERLAGGEHRVLTGVCLLGDGIDERVVETAVVRVGEIGAEAIEGYVASGAWRGKAGGYNLRDRLEEGWPIEFEGDPASIMGLPMRRLAPMLDRLLSV